MAKTRKSRASRQQQQNDAVLTEDPEQQQQDDEPMDQNDNVAEEEEQQNDDVLEEEEEEEQNDDVEETENENDTSVMKSETNGEEKDDDVEEEEEEDEEEDEDEPVEKLLEPFSKQQLVLLMKEAVSKHPDLIPSVENIADADPAHRKIFVHGLGWDTTTETLIEEYSKYGEIEDCKAVVDKVSGKSKGYGFILFKHRVGAKRALKQPQKKIGNRVTNCQLASAGPVPAGGGAGAGAAAQGVEKVSEYTQRKIFVSNVAAEIDPGKLTEFFSRFGEIEEGPLGLDKQTGKPKGFALFVYKSVESAKKALEEPKKVFEGHTLNVVKAVDGPKPGKGFGQGQGQGQFGGGGGHGHHVSKKAKFNNGHGHGHGHGQGHLMAPSGPPVGFNPGVPPPALTPVLGQALSALLNQGGGIGLGNLFGGLGNPQGMPPSGYQGGGYQQGGYGNPQGGNRSQGGGSYMGQGR